VKKEMNKILSEARLPKKIPVTLDFVLAQGQEYLIRRAREALLDAQLGLLTEGNLKIALRLIAIALVKMKE
jgi:hypothetical protein